MRRILILGSAILALSLSTVARVDGQAHPDRPAALTGSTASRTVLAPTTASLSFTATPLPPTLTVSKSWPDRLCLDNMTACAPFAAVRAFVADYAQQRVDLTAPVTTPNAIRAEVEIIHKERKPVARIVAEVWLLDAGGNRIGDPIRDEHTGATAAALLLTLNQVSRTKSEDQMVLEHMQNAAAHGGVAPIPAGSISGTPN